MLNNLKRRGLTLLLSLAMIITYMPLSMMTAYAAEGDPEYPVPETSKVLIDNEDGTYTLKLSVTGSAKSETENPKVNVIFIMDRSGSMQNNQAYTGESGYRVYQYGRYGKVGSSYPQLYYTNNGTTYTAVGNNDNHATVYTRSGTQGNYTYTQYTGTRYNEEDNMRRDWVAIAAASSLADDLLSYNTAASPDTVEMAFVSFNDMATNGNNGNWTTSQSTAQSVIRGYTGVNNTGTNWEDALIHAKSLADNKADDADQEGEQMFIIFLTDGNPTRYVNNQGQQAGTGQESSGNITTCYNEASPRALALTNAGYELYNIGVFGSVDRMEDLTDDANEATATGHGSATYYPASDADELEEAFAEILRSITNSLALSDVKFTDGVTDMTHSTGVNGNPGNFQYTITVNGVEEPWDDAPPATVNADKEVIWDLSKDNQGNDLIIADGVTVTCSFLVWPDQDAMDLIADLNNKKVSYDTLTNDQKAQITGGPDGPFALKTNTEAKLDYSILENRDGDIHEIPQEPITLDPPEPMPLYIDWLSLEKKWDDSLDPEQREEVEGKVVLDFYKDNTKYILPGYESGITLTEAENWIKTDFLSIATGIMVSEESPAYDADKYPVVTYDGKDYCILETGHDYHFQEQDINDHYELTAYTYHPMLVDGELHNLTFEKDAAGNITGVTEGAEISTVSATNTIKGGVSITKKVVDEDGNEVDTADPFTITMHMQTPEGNAYKYDYRIYYGEKNPHYNDPEPGTENPSEEEMARNLERHRSGHFIGTGTEVTLTLYQGDEIRFVNVDDDTRYYVEETVPQGYELDGISYQIRYGEDDPATEDIDESELHDFTEDQMETIDGKTYYIMDGNSSAAVEVTNILKKGDLKVTKTVVDGDTNKEFEFTLDLKDAEEAAVSGTFGYVIYKTSDDSTVTEGTISSGGKFKLKDGQYIIVKGLPAGTKYTVTETAAAGYTTTSTGATGTIVVDDPTTTAVEMASAAFTNTYDASGEGTIEVTKALRGATWPTGKSLTITLAGTGDAPMPQGTTVTLTAAGKATFGPIPYELSDAGKTYTYTITEGSFGDGWTGTPASITATVAVTDNGDGTLATEVTYSPEDATFTNEYDAEGEATLRVNKKVAGAAWPADKKLNLTLAAVTENAPMPEVTVREMDREGYVEFGPIPYELSDAGKTYNYKITETSFGTGWTGAPTEVTAAVTVTDNGDGTLSTSVKYTPEDATFTNTYDATGSVVLEAVKAIEGAEWPEGETITFTLAGTGGTLPETKTVNLTEPGTARFGAITYTEEDIDQTYTYTITENGFGAGWTGSPEQITATVQVTDNGDGTLATTVTYNPTNKTFTNTYEAAGDATIEVTKEISGAAWPSGKTLTLTLTGANGAPMPETTTATISAAGKVTFGPIPYDESDVGKSYTYTVSENGFGAGWTGSGNVTAEVTVTDNGDGTLGTSIVYTPGNAKIINTYEAEGTAVLEATKAIEGAEWPEDATITFTLAGTGGTLPATKTVVLTEPGKATFGAITYDESDAGQTYTYTISEDGFGEGWTGSGPITATVVVTDNGNGTLSTAVTYSPESDTITNTYEAEGSAVLKAKKAISGAAWPEDATITFTLAGTGGTLPATKTVTLSEVGEASFGAITYDESDAGHTYTYTITEDGFGTGWTGSPETITATVVVTDNGDGTLGTTVTYDPEDRTFTNTYKAEGEVVLDINKALAGAEWPEGKTITMTLAGTGGTLPATKTVTLRAAGKASFGAIKYDESDAGKTYTYTISEDGFGDGWTGSGPVTATVVVTDNGDGTLSTSVTYTNNDTITNTYVAEGTAVLQAIKAIEGAGWPEDATITFTLDGEGGTLPTTKTVELTEPGTATFGAITYDESDAGQTYTYTITEDGFGTGWTGAPESITATVVVTDNGDGTLGTTVTYDPEDDTITNTYEAEGEAVLEINKALAGAEWPEGKTITMTLAGTGGTLPETKTVTLSAAGKAAFGAIKYDESDAGKTYTYTISEDGFGTGWTGSGPVTATVVVTDNGDGTLGTTVTYTNNDTITNTYEAEGEATITVTKALKGAAWPEGKTLTLTLAGSGNAPMPATTTAKLTATGSANFGPIAYDESDAGKTYTYTVSEDGFGTGWTGSGDVTATVVVTDNGDGTLATAVTYSPENATITNTYEAEGTAVLKATKELNGRAWKSGDSFTFELINELGETVDTQTATADSKTVTFKAETFTQDDLGDHTYTITEKSSESDLPPGVTKTSGDITATVTVTDNGDGTLGTSVKYSPESDTIINTYVPAPVKAQIDVTKTIEGFLEGETGTADSTFTFTLFEEDGETVVDVEGNPIEITTSGGTGSASFPEIEYDKAGTYKYIVQETKGDKAGMTYDVTKYPVTVTVTDNTDTGKLEAKVSYGDGEESTATSVDVINIFDLEDVDVTLKLTKTIDDQSDSAPEGTFNFKLYKDSVSDDNFVEEKTITTNGLTGSAEFSKLTFDAAGEYTYVVVEEGGSENGFTYDTTEHEYKIIIDDNFDAAILEVNKDSTLDVEITNIYKATSTSAILEVTKEIEDTSGSAYDTEFTFTLKDSSGTTLDTKSIVGAGKVSFEEIPYEKAGTYNYTIQESAGTAAGYKYDTAEYKVKVEVSDNKGQLEADVVYVDKTGTDSTQLTITNTYDPEDAKVVLKANKMIEDKTGGAGGKTFTFELRDADGSLVESVSRVSGGPVEFSELVFKKVGEYKYTIQEVEGSDKGYTYDSTKYEVTVTVTDPDKDGMLKAAVSPDPEEIVFTNPYEAEPVDVEIEATKVMIGRKLKNGEFTFMLMDGDIVISESKNTADGKIVFDKITYELPGTYSYTIVEVEGDDEDVTYDTDSYNVVVTVTDDGSGELKASITGKAEFTNTYEPPENPDKPDTGDSNNLGGWLALMLLAGAGSAGLYARRRRENQ